MTIDIINQATKKTDNDVMIKIKLTCQHNLSSNQVLDQELATAAVVITDNNTEQLHCARGSTFHMYSLN